MTTSWSLEELRASVKARHGDHQLTALQPHLNSVDWKIRIATYHSYAYSEAFSPFFDEGSDGRISAIKLMLSNGEEASKFREAKLIAEANIIACAQCTHSVSDILSYVISYSLKVDDGGEQELSLSDINKKLTSGPLKREVTRFLGLKEYRYLQDFVNTTKHISLVFSEYSVNHESNDDRDHGVIFKAFAYKDRKHTEKSAHDFVNELRSISIGYVRIGRALNEAVR